MRNDLYKVFARDLERNDFSRSGELGHTMVQASPGPDSLQRLFGKSCEYEIVLQSKYKSTYDANFRPGGHLHPAYVLNLTDRLEDIEEEYWKHCQVFDFDSVFSLVLASPFDEFRMSSGKVRHSDERQKWSEAVWKFSGAFGRWVGVIDIARFYEQLTPTKLLDLFGSKHLAVNYKLVDEITLLIRDFVDPDFHRGLPQGYIFSDLVARLALTPLDRHLRDLNIPYIRWVDDIWFFAADAAEADLRMKQVRKALEDFGFMPIKMSIEPGSRLSFLAQGMVWGEVPIENYGDGEWFPNEKPASPYRLSDALVNLQRFDLLRLYEDEYAPARKCRSDHGNRFALRQMGRFLPTRIRKDLAALVQERPYAIPHMLRAMRSDASAIVEAYSNIRGWKSREDDRMRVIESAHPIQRTSLSEKLLVSKPKARAVRQALFGNLPPNNKSIELARDNFAHDCWHDEAATVFRLCKNTGTSTARMFSDTILRFGSDLKPLYDLI